MVIFKKDVIEDVLQTLKGVMQKSLFLPRKLG